jgi:hypothetical protein
MICYCAITLILIHVLGLDKGTALYSGALIICVGLYLTYRAIRARS